MSIEGGAAPEVVVAILNWNGYALTKACVESLGCLDGPAHRILVVDNASREREAERLAAEFPGRVEARPLPRNLGVGGGYNAAIRWARDRGARYVLLMNNDTLVDDPRFLRELLAAAGPDVFAVGPLIRDAAGRIWSSGGTMDWSTYLSGHTQERDMPPHDGPYRVPWIDGSCMLVSVEAACRVGGFDESFFLYWEEVDVCLRAARLGLVSVVQPATSLRHLVGGTTRPSQVDRFMLRNSIYFLRRHANRRQNLDFLLRLTFHRVPLFAARRIKHGGGIRATVSMCVGAYAWNVRDAIRERGWIRRATGSISCPAEASEPPESKAGQPA